MKKLYILGLVLSLTFGFAQTNLKKPTHCLETILISMLQKPMKNVYKTLKSRRHKR